MGSNGTRDGTRTTQHAAAVGRPIAPDLLTVAQAASLLRVSRRTVERLVARGQLPFYALPVRGGLRFDRVELTRWLAERHRDELE